MSDIASYGIHTSSAPIRRGHIVCLSATSGDPTVVKATPEALAVGGTVVGIVIRREGPLVRVNVSGVVPNSITNLSAGYAGAVYVDPDARCTRIATGIDYLVGSCDTQGNLKVEPVGRLSSHNLTGVLNVRAFGAVGDGSTDDLPSFKAAIAASIHTGRLVWAPKGRYRFSDHLVIDRVVELFGDGAGLEAGGTELIFDPGKSFMVGARCVIRNLGIWGNPVEGLLLHSESQWRSGTRYEVGAVVRPTNDNRYYFKCIKAGVSGDTEPDSWGNAHLCSDTTTWASADYVQGTLRSVVRREGDFERVFRCDVAGRSGSDAPDWNLEIDAITRDPDTEGLEGTESTVQWRTISASPYFTRDNEGDDEVIWEHAGVHIRDSCEVRDCFIANFSNAGVHIQGDSTPTYAQPNNCNTWHLSRLNISRCGLGVAIQGIDSNAGVLTASQ